MNNTSRLAQACGFHGPQSVPLDKLHEVAADRLEAAREMVEALDAMRAMWVCVCKHQNWDAYDMAQFAKAEAALAKYRGEV